MLLRLPRPARQFLLRRLPLYQLLRRHLLRLRLRQVSPAHPWHRQYPPLRPRRRHLLHLLRDGWEEVVYRAGGT